MEGKIAPVTYPEYVRDNIHVTLLAKAYRDFAELIQSSPGFTKLNPSGYVESQGEFTERFAMEMRKRLHLPCEVKIFEQTEFLEPKVRVNTDNLNIQHLQWDEKNAWDQLAQYYQEKHQQNLSQKN